MFEINIYGEPPSAEKIRQLKGSFDDSAAFTVFVMVPIPGVDILAGLATYAIEKPCAAPISRIPVSDSAGPVPDRARLRHDGAVVVGFV